MDELGCCVAVAKDCIWISLGQARLVLKFDAFETDHDMNSWSSFPYSSTGLTSVRPDGLMAGRAWRKCGLLFSRLCVSFWHCICRPGVRATDEDVERRECTDLKEEHEHSHALAQVLGTWQAPFQALFSPIPCGRDDVFT